MRRVSPTLQRGEEADLWEPVAELWLQRKPQALWRRHSDAVNTSLLERWLPPSSGRVLKTDVFDEAVGEGLYPVLSARAASVAVVDISTRLLKAAKERYPELETVHGDVRRLPFADDEFDVVVSNSTLDHVQSRGEIVEALRELHRVLRPGGRLVLTLDNPANPLMALTKLLPRRALNRLWLGHGRRGARIGIVPYCVGATIGIRPLRRILPTLGFDVVATDAIVHVPRPLAVLVGEWLAAHVGAQGQREFLAALMRFERLARLPTRFLTGHFVAVHAVKSIADVAGDGPR
jgi:SAM-dependent methyltransferase